MDDLEQQLRRQTFRSIPQEWRSEILEAAECARRDVGTRPTPGELWHAIRAWLWPAPQAWGALAAIWVVVLTINLVANRPATQEAERHSPAAEIAVAMQQQRQLRLELLDEGSEIPPAAPKARPRSQRATTNFNA